jgi:hypothetical protein
MKISWYSSTSGSHPAPRGVSERWLLQQANDTVSATFGVPSFEVAPTQVMSFKNFPFMGAAYHGIGARILPFSITPSDATSPHALAMVAADRIWAYAFHLEAPPPESGALHQVTLADFET